MVNAVIHSPQCSLYRLPAVERVSRFIASTPESRRICNDPFVVGFEYTAGLRTACAAALRALGESNSFQLSEAQTCVFHILRGGLNFGLREALHDAYGWNRHASAFVSAQRARKSDNTEEWYITEHDYQKIYLPVETDLVFGDVVATGTSLRYGLERIIEQVSEQGKSIRSVLFFTIGGKRSEEIITEVAAQCRELSAGFKAAAVVYLEGCFAVADENTEMQIKFTGTDLLRTNSILAPEFIESQYEDPAYPLERCTIYDAGSRAFWLPEYIEDVRDYWEQTKALAENGLSFTGLCEERFPELDATRFGSVDLVELCKGQIRKAASLQFDGR